MSPHLQARLHQRLRASGGYTIDQTILIVAIIAILVTMIILTVGWNLINKSSGTKLAAQMRQVEDANGQFYASYQIWPHMANAAGNNPQWNMITLQGFGPGNNYSQAMGAKAQVPGYANKNFLPGITNTAATGWMAKHTFGAGGNIEEYVQNNPFGNNGQYYVVRFAAVPMSDVKNAKRTIDGDTSTDYTRGRVIASTNDCLGLATGGVDANTPDSQVVNVCYVANLIN